MVREFNFAELCDSAEPMVSFRDPRQSVMLHATIVQSESGATAARVRNISRGGIMAECRFRGMQGDRVAISLRGLGEFAGSVAWVRQDRIGVRFDAPVDPTALMRRPVANPSASSQPRTPPRAWRPAIHSPRTAGR